MDPEPIFLWNGGEGILEIYLHGRAPSCVQTLMLELKVPGTDYVYCPVPVPSCVSLTSREPSGQIELR